MSDGDLPYTDEALAEQNHKELVDPALLEKAVERMRNAARGNGIKPESITLDQFDGEVLHFAARSMFVIKPTVLEKTLPGRENGEICASQSDMRMRIRKVVENTTFDRDIVQTVTDLLERRSDKGFLINNLAVKLGRLNRKFFYYSNCSNCHGGVVNCPTCKGQGLVTCPRCRGQRKVVCELCNGSRVNIDPSNGQSIPCRKCNGRGESQCLYCGTNGRLKCRPCSGSGRASCPKCNATGIMSNMGYVTFEAKTQFDYDREILPPEVPPLIDQLGPDMAIQQHADIQILKHQEQYAAQREYHGPDRSGQVRDELLVPFYNRLPWGKISFQVGPEKIGGQLFGFHPRLINIPPFLEKPIRPGLKKLSEAADKLGQVQGHVEDAIQYRVIADAMIAAATLPPKKAMAAMRKRWSLGIRPELTDKMTLMADKAFRHLSLMSRLTGLGVGLLVSAVFFWVYFDGPLRKMALPFIPGLFLAVIDVALIVVLGFATVAMSRFLTKRNLGHLFQRVMAAEKARKIVPRAGHTGWIGYSGVACIFVAIILITKLTGHPMPSWADLIWKPVR